MQRTLDETARLIAGGMTRREGVTLLCGSVAAALLESLRARNAGAHAAERVDELSPQVRAATATGNRVCQMRRLSTGCVKLGGGIRPFYHEGWVCPSKRCLHGYCSARKLGGLGKCGVTLAQLRHAVKIGEMKVLKGQMPK